MEIKNPKEIMEDVKENMDDVKEKVDELLEKHPITEDVIHAYDAVSRR